ncbi:hypothetical protein CJF42_02685 [Pseudoalteromonas sp. NBT06-2]|uniref:hypothetical protein n=1 Tax=Pseudoalteromonas sp. NBT06-2 TaxID=2025950 RepID=UPI000BA511A8|nr:hypothetical protein [Pseudoalteromonas sp. NBT06-2]PAJ75947.1 hypothetical protein CJF42_02685 [Pseudoalteromonas sp. NBT06-2]
MKNPNLNTNTTVNAIRTTDGFIEITSLELLDEMVGGLINPEAALCQLQEDEINTTKYSVTEAI